MNLSKCILVFAFSIAATAADAHHSAAMYTNETKLATGTVKAWEWQNPHSFLQLVIPDGNGGSVEAGFEFGSPNTLIRNGFRADTFQPGDKASIYYRPRRDGLPGGGASTVYTYKEKKWLVWGPAADVAAAKEAAAKREAAQTTGGDRSAEDKGGGK